MRVVHVIGSFNIGGIERNLLNYLINSRLQGVNHIVIVENNEGELKSLYYNNSEIIKLKKRSSIKIFSGVINVFRIIQKLISEKAGIVVFYHFGCAKRYILPVKLFTNVKIITHQRNLAHSRTKIDKKIMQILYLFADKIVVNSEFTKKWIINHLGNRSSLNNKINIVKNIIDFDLYHSKYDDSWINNFKYKKIIKIGMIGRLLPVKGYHFFIDVCKELVDKYSEKTFEFHIIGDGPDYGKLSNKIKYLKLSDHVLIHRDLHDPIIIQNLFDILFFTSYSEGMPNAVLESLLSRKIVVSTSVGGINNIIINGYNGFLIEPGNKETALEKLSEIINGSQNLSYILENNKKLYNEYNPIHVTRMISQIYIN